MRFGTDGRALRKLRGVDPTIYLKAIVLLFRNPSILLAPLVAALLSGTISLLSPTMVTGGGAGSINASLAQLVAQLLNAAALAVALIVADLAWRRGGASFDEAWRDAMRKSGDILMAAIGFNFIIWVAFSLGSFVGTGIGGLILGALALYFFIYTMPAAALGGTPGGAALQASFELARGNPLPTAGVAIAYVVTFFILSGYAASWLLVWLATLGVASSALITLGVIALAQALAAGYVALVLSKTYTEISYGRRWY